MEPVNVYTPAKQRGFIGQVSVNVTTALVVMFILWLLQMVFGD